MLIKTKPKFPKQRSLIKIQEKFFKWSESSTSHGYPNIFRTQHLSIRILWSISFLTSSILCFLLVYKSITEYFNFDVVTKVRVIEESPTLFPVVTICNKNPFLTSEAAKLIESTYFSYMNESGQLNKSNLSSFKSDYLLLRSVTNKAKLLAYNPDFGDQNRKLLGYEINRTVYQCVFNSLYCEANEFSFYYSLEYGNCYQFNSGHNMNAQPMPLKYLYSQGEDNGLFLVIYLNKVMNEYITTYSSGYKIFIHNHTYEAISTNPIDAKPGSLTNIGIKKTFIYKAQSPFSECDRLTEFTSELYELIVRKNVTYRQVDCFDLCLQKMVISACQCYSLKYLKLVDGVGPCLSLDELKCFKQENDRFLQSEKSKLCGDQCPLECNSVDYEFSYSISDFPTEEYFNSFKLNSSSKKIYLNGEYVNFETYKKSFIGLNIYYPYLKYTEIVEVEKFSLIDLLSNIGGTLGLFLGISFLSFIEIFEILFEIFLVLVRN